MPLTDFKRRAAEHVKRMRETGRPLILTVNGRAAFVVQDVEDYQAMLERVEEAGTVAAVRESLAEYAHGDVRDDEEVFDEIRKKHSLPR